MARWLIGLLALAACTPSSAPPLEPKPMHAAPNPVPYFEIPVTDMERAVAFYSAVFGYDFTRDTVDGYEMALFPYDPNGHGASGALAKGDVYVPSKTGPILYFRVAEIDPVLTAAAVQGGKILYPKKSIGDLGYVAEFKDSEGNRIALSAPP